MRVVCVFRFTFFWNWGLGCAAQKTIRCVCVRALRAVAALRCVFVQECLRHEEACGGRRSGASLAGVLPTLYGPSAFQLTGSKYSQSKETAPRNIAPNSPLDDLRTVHLRWFMRFVGQTLYSSQYSSHPSPPPLYTPPFPRFGDSLPQHDANHPRYVWLFINRAAAVCAKQEVTQGLESSSSSPSESGSSIHRHLMCPYIINRPAKKQQEGSTGRKPPPSSPGRQARAGSLQPSRSRPDHAFSPSLPPSRR